MNIGILGVIPWREVIESKHVASDLMLRVHGPWAARTGDGDDHLDRACVRLRGALGYSRIPYASARAGHFFKMFAATHPTGHFPHRSLLLIERPGDGGLPGGSGDCHRRTPGVADP